VKKILLFLVLILGGLILTGGSPVKKRECVDPNNKDIFIRGKLTFKDKKMPVVRFWIEGEKENYSLIIFEENSTTINERLKTTSDSVSVVFKERISSFLLRNTFNGVKRDFIVIDFNNKKIEEKRLRELIPLGYQIVREIQEKTGGRVSGYFIIQLE